MPVFPFPKFMLGCAVFGCCRICLHAPCHRLMLWLRPLSRPQLCPPRLRPCCCCIGIMFVVSCWTGGTYITCATLLALCSCACSVLIFCCCAAFFAVRFAMLPCDAAASSAASSATSVLSPAWRADIVGFTQRYSFFHKYLMSAQTLFWAVGSSSHLL